MKHSVILNIGNFPTNVQIRGLGNDYSKVKDPQGSVNQPISLFKITANAYRVLREQVIQYYGKPGEKREATLIPEQAEELRKAYDRLLGWIGKLEELDKAGEYDGNLQLKNAVEELINPVIVNSLKNNLADMMKESVNVSEEKVNALIDRFVENMYEDGRIDFGREHIRTYESHGMTSIIPRDIQANGNSRQIAQFYLANEAILADYEKQYLKAHIQNLELIRRMGEENKKYYAPKLTRIMEDGMNMSMPNLKLYGQQSTLQGCWSCAMQLLLQSRGVMLDQQNIRAYRPSKLGVSEVFETSPRITAGLVADTTHSPFESADLVMETLPNTAFHNMSIYYSRGDSPEKDADQKRKAAYALDRNLRKALTQHHSPVAITDGSHYVTVYGFEGDKFLIRDSRDNPQNHRTVTAEQFLASAEKCQKGQAVGVQFSWLEDLVLEKDGTCKNFENTPFARINYKDGRVERSNLDGDLSDSVNVMGVNFNKEMDFEEDIQVSESVYVPEKLIETALYMQADAQEEPRPVAREEADDDDFHLFHDEEMEDDGFNLFKHDDSMVEEPQTDAPKTVPTEAPAEDFSILKENQPKAEPKEEPKPQFVAKDGEMTKAEAMNSLEVRYNWARKTLADIADAYSRGDKDWATATAQTQETISRMVAYNQMHSVLKKMPENAGHQAFMDITNEELADKWQETYYKDGKPIGVMRDALEKMDGRILMGIMGEDKIDNDVMKEFSGNIVKAIQGEASPAEKNIQKDNEINKKGPQLV